MATVVRLKRRRDEDPLEVLLLAAKKHKGEQGKEDSADVTCDKSVFKFAGTVSSKVYYFVITFRVTFISRIIHISGSSGLDTNLSDYRTPSFENQGVRLALRNPK